MKLEAFETLGAVLSEGSFAAAAAAMNLTPSAVSMQMKHLEQYLGQPLFRRAGLRVQPTAMAHQVIAAMREGLQQIDVLRRRNTVVVEGTIRLGLIESIQPMLLPGTMRVLRDTHPRLLLRPQRGRSAGLTADVKAGVLDAAVAAQPEKGRVAGLIWYPLLKRELVLIAPPDAKAATVYEYLRHYDWIRYDRQTTTGAMGARYVREVMAEKRSALELDSVTAIVAMVSAGLGVSVLQVVDPRVCEQYPVKTIRLGASPPTLQLSVVTRKDDADSRLLLAVREALSLALKTTRP
ncbi:LysR family transcriptional regulator [Caballeronia sordidicola]|jgi:DNA-binding transcriptional LysR family regulator|uniref:Transcriptional regulator, LysR family n=1 Tax=Caballeronia sordidicola TaxID=196367 RepID=A0A242MFR1_CABSO|nr:LysR family transcriptional regulator [Caballeronia sordidicola]OTP69580.1 Transcriptional regulator, LysR family [Caballeronia sordidicola]